ncbi:amine sulfotransferase-like isoform X1 [Anneissia japonica]|uniref:amine sulfotransferase-like isoform X1 n=2 Tax=Anneissia japonica TaxID=1529436 RepID=UPI0014256197|nr:amine sulfotransferase-like isoform X1 [Anneissia japonica]
MSCTADRIPKEGEFSGFVVLEGNRYPPQVRPDMVDLARSFEVRDDDVFIVTYPKAGTHWMTEIVKSILADGDYEKAEKMFGIHPKPLEFFTTLSDYAKRPRDKQRVIVTHLHEELLPKAALNGKAKIVFVIRNPKDSVVSYFHFAQPFRYAEEFDTWEGFLKCFMSEGMPGRSWFNYNLTYWKHRNEKNFYWTTYENMKLDIRSVIEDVASFLGHPASGEKLDKLVKLADFSRMNKKYDGRFPKASVPDNVREAIPFKILRKGQVGDWKNKFTVAQNEAFDKLYNEKMKCSSLKQHIKFEI